MTCRNLWALHVNNYFSYDSFPHIFPTIYFSRLFYIINLFLSDLCPHMICFMFFPPNDYIFTSDSPPPQGFIYFHTILLHNSFFHIIHLFLQVIFAHDSHSFSRLCSWFFNLTHFLYTIFSHKNNLFWPVIGKFDSLEWIK